MNFFAGEIALGTLSDLWNSLDFSAMLAALMRLIAVFLCLTVHETCHGLAAYALGDPTAKREHRLSLNPLHHIDWVGLACMLVLGFGWAKPVPVNMMRFRSPKRGMALTALAGPVSNLLLPMLLVFGLLEFVGALLTKVMRPLFKVPGRAAVDCITSWIGDGTLGVMLTCNQYEGGYYSAKEASIIATLFSAVSITFTLVVLETVGMLDKFGIYYLIVCFVGIVCAIVCPYLYPLRKKPNTYLVEGKAAPDTLPEGYKSNDEYGMDLALKRVSHFPGIGGFLQNGAKNACNMWFGILPTVMCIGTIALICANYTNIFQVLGTPFLPLLKLLQVPDASAAASTMIIGYTDMFTPSILIAGAGACDMTRFIVAVVSVTQVLYLSEVGGLILGSKLPLNIWELFVIFLERTIISLLIVCPIAHLLF